MEIIEETPVAAAAAKKMLEEKEKERELVYEQKNALEHLRKFVKIAPKKAEDMYQELQSIKKLRPKHIISIIDHLPEDADDLRVILYGLDLTPEEKKKILDTVKKFS